MCIRDRFNGWDFFGRRTAIRFCYHIGVICSCKGIFRTWQDALRWGNSFCTRSVVPRTAPGNHLFWLFMEHCKWQMCIRDSHDITRLESVPAVQSSAVQSQNDVPESLPDNTDSPCLLYTSDTSTLCMTSHLTDDLHDHVPCWSEYAF